MAQLKELLRVPIMLPKHGKSELLCYSMSQIYRLNADCMYDAMYITSSRRICAARIGK